MMIFLYYFYERKVTSDISTSLRNLSHLIHHNFLMLLELIFGRISGQSTSNVWLLAFSSSSASVVLV
jgi:hypothetical protein